MKQYKIHVRTSETGAYQPGWLATFPNEPKIGDVFVSADNARDTNTFRVDRVGTPGAEVEAATAATAVIDVMVTLVKPTQFAAV